MRAKAGIGQLPGLALALSNWGIVDNKLKVLNKLKKHSER
jgi:hypothetical protein